ncbi:hypothetical protein KY386_00470 [Candidatus Parcubacteria bacterium]|nr:hypothetical protein [Candidatus Parcubacteria bacterium]
MGAKATQAELAAWAVRSNQLFEMFKTGVRPAEEVLALLQRGINGQFTDALLSGNCPLVIDFDRSIAEMVAAGGYDHANDDITYEHFPVSESGTVKACAIFVHLNRVVTDAEVVLAEIDRLGLRPGTMPELLALGAHYPDLQRQFPIVALGSVWTNPHGRRGVGCLWSSSPLRYLDLHWFGDRWYSHDRFLAFCE